MSSPATSSVMTPFGPVITMPQTRFRRGDYALTIKFYQDAGIPIWNMITAGHFEGGDFMVVEPGFVLCGYGGERSEKEGAEQMCDWFRAEGWEAYPVPFPPHFVHLDVSVGFINEKLVAVAQDAHQPWFLNLLNSKGYEILPISYLRTRRSLEQISSVSATIGCSRQQRTKISMPACARSA